MSGMMLQWLIERGQPEGQVPTVWFSHTYRDRPWVTDAWQASMFRTSEEADAYISDHLTHPTRGASARAVEHGFLAAPDRPSSPLSPQELFDANRAYLTANGWEERGPKSWPWRHPSEQFNRAFCSALDEQFRRDGVL